MHCIGNLSVEEMLERCEQELRSNPDATIVVTLSSKLWNEAKTMPIWPIEVVSLPFHNCVTLKFHAASLRDSIMGIQPQQIGHL